MDNIWQFLGQIAFTAVLILGVSLRFRHFAKHGKAKQDAKIEQARSLNEMARNGDPATRKSRYRKHLLASVVILATSSSLIAFSATKDWSATLAFCAVGLVSGLLLGAVSLVISQLAEDKGKSFSGFFWLSMLASPLIGLLVLIAIGKGDTAPTSDDFSAKLAALDDLRQRGILSEAEFLEKKEAILKRI